MDFKLQHLTDITRLSFDILKIFFRILLLQMVSTYRPFSQNTKKNSINNHKNNNNDTITNYVK